MRKSSVRCVSRSRYSIGAYGPKPGARFFLVGGRFFGGGLYKLKSNKNEKVKISKLYEFEGLNRVEVEEATIGSIVAISGIADIHIGDTWVSVPA